MSAVAYPTLRRWASSGSVAAGATTVIKAPDDITSDFVYITRLGVNITVHANAKNLSVEDTAGSPVLIAVIADLTVASGTNRGEQYVYDFGKRGFKATLGKTISIVSDAAGPAAVFVAEGFQSKV